MVKPMEVFVTPNPIDPKSRDECPIVPSEPTGWTLHILSPEQSERLLRDESRVSAFEVIAELERKYASDRQHG